MEKISVIIPAYNEVECIEQTVHMTVKELDLLNNPYEIVIVDDGSNDGTEYLVDQLAEESEQISVVHHAENLGVGKAFRLGIEQSSGDLITTIPADGQISPSGIKRFVEEISDVDFVTTHRLAPYKSVYRRALTNGMQLFIYCLFGAIPKQEAGRMFRRRILDHFQLTKTSAVVNFEIIAKAHKLGFRFKEIEMEILPRQKGVTKIATISGILKMMVEFVQLRFSKEFRNLRLLKDE